MRLKHIKTMLMHLKNYKMRIYWHMAEKGKSGAGPSPLDLLMKIYFVYKKIITGGCELLIERLGREFTKRSIPTCLIYQSIEQTMLTRFQNTKIELLCIESWNRNYIFPIFDSTTKSYIVTFIWNDFLICNIKKSYLRTVFYAVHNRAFEMGKNKTFFFKQLHQRIAKNGIVSLNNNGQLICMDEQTIEYTKDVYGFNKLDIPILRIAIDVVPENNRIKGGFEIKLLTIARAEFPFKGYILGLLDWFATTNESVFLTIVSYGPDEKKIIEKIGSFDESIKLRVKLVGKTDYDQIAQYYEKADLYVGMGTTLLDASLRGLVSIPVQAYTYDLITDSFFFEDYRKLGLDKGSKSRFNELFARYVAMDYNEKNSISQKSRDAVVDNYSTPVIIDKFLSALNSTVSNSSTLGLELLRTYHIIKARIKGISV